jgi:hypothetical protein
MIFQMLLSGQCYENVYNLNTLNVDSLYVSVNVFVTLATQQHLEYHCKSLFNTPCILTGMQYLNSREEKKFVKTRKVKRKYKAMRPIGL